MLGKDGNLYGVTSEGGDSLGSGIIYKMTLGGKITILYSFCHGSLCNDGNGPTGISLGSDGNFYGTTSGGGEFSEGVLFKISPTGKFTLLHTFCSRANCADGEVPVFPPHRGTDGNFYGTTNGGGAAALPGGVVYKLTLAGAYSVVKSFCQPSASCNTGFYPTTVVQDANRNLFGTAQNNGSFNSGIVFEITSANKFKVLHRFNFDGGQAPANGLTLADDGNFYGVGINNDDFASTAAGFGTIFKVTPQGVFSTVHTFEDGPSGPLFQAADGNLYGVTGGDGKTDFGAVYRFSIGGGATLRTIPEKGEAGKEILILGNGLTETTSVMFNGVPAAFTVEKDTFIRATVPEGAATGAVSVVTPSGPLTSNPQFFVTK